MSREGSKVASCLGVMVAPRVAITAGHCVVGRSDTTVQRAVTPAQARRSDPIAVSSIWFDPDANTRGAHVDTHNSDLAILVLQRPLAMPAYVSYARGPLRQPTPAVAARHISRSSVLEPMEITVRASPRASYYLSGPFAAPGDSGSPILVRAPDGKLTVVAVLAGGSSEHELLARTDVMSDKLDELVVSTAVENRTTKPKQPKTPKQPKASKPPTPMPPVRDPNVTWL